MKPLAPIAIFVFNRPAHTERMLMSLRQNPEFLHSPVYIFCDGAKNESQLEDVQKTRALVRELAPQHAEITERTQNMGLAPSIIEGVSKLMNEFGRTIVIEDDLVLSRTALRYLNQGLDVYERKRPVMHISAYMFPVQIPLPELFFYREVTCWGWASWARAWKHFVSDSTVLLEKIHAKNELDKFNVGGSMDFLGMLKLQAAGKINSWAIRWYASMHLQNGLALHPGQSLVQNEGFDGSGVHCGVEDLYKVNKADSLSTFPTSIKESSAAVRAMMTYRQPPPMSRKNKFKHVIKKILLGQNFR